MKRRLTRGIVAGFAAVTLAASGASMATANPLGSLQFQIPNGNGDQMVWQGPIEGDVNSYARQTVKLGNGVTATIELDVPARRVSVSADNGTRITFGLNSLRAYVGANRSGELQHPVTPLANSCDVATGVAGIAHSALWGAALGGPAGVAAGIAVGAFWWGVSQGC